MSPEEAHPSRFKRALWVVGALAYAAIALVLLSLWRMPVDNMLRSVESTILARTGHAVQFGPGTIRWSGGVRIDSVEAQIRTQGATIPVELDAIEIRPQWISSLLGRPGARIEAAAYGGKVEAWARSARWQPSTLSQATLRVSEVDLSTVSALQALLGGRVRGNAQVAVELAVDGPEPNQWRGRGGAQISELDMQNVTLGGLTIERLPLGRIEVEMEIPPEVGEAQIRRCEMGGAEVELTASGRVVLARDLPRSRLEVQCRIRLTGQTRETLGEALTLMGFTADEQGWTQIVVSGTLQQPRAASARLETPAAP